MRQDMLTGDSRLAYTDFSALRFDVEGANGFLSNPEARSREAGLLLSIDYDTSAYRDSAFQYLNVPFPSILGGAVPKRRAEYLAGRVLARAAIRMVIGLAAIPSPGKEGVPSWPVGISGSISHSHGRALCQVCAGDNLVGIDIEKVADPTALKSITNLVASPDEAALLSESPLDSATGLTMLFSVKEAVFKAIYPSVRRFFGFEAVRLCTVPAQGTMRLRVIEDLAPDFSAGHILTASYECQDNFVLTSCFARVNKAGYFDQHRD